MQLQPRSADIGFVIEIAIVIDLGSDEMKCFAYAYAYATRRVRGK